MRGVGGQGRGTWRIARFRSARAASAGVRGGWEDAGADADADVDVGLVAFEGEDGAPGLFPPC